MSKIDKFILISISFFCFIFLVLFLDVVLFSKNKLSSECGKFTEIKTKKSERILNMHNLALPASQLCTGAEPGWHYPNSDLPEIVLKFNKQKIKRIYLESQRDEIDRFPSDIEIDFYLDNKIVGSIFLKTNCKISENLKLNKEHISDKIVFKIKKKCLNKDGQSEILTVIRNIILN